MPGNSYQYVPRALQGKTAPEGAELLREVTNQALRRSLAEYPTEQAQYEYDRRNAALVASQAAQFGDVAYNLAEGGIDIAGKLAGPMSRAANVSARLAKASPYVNVGVNLLQGGLTTASGESPYGGWEPAPGYVAALDLADSAPAIAGAAYAGPPGAFVAQTLFGGAASRAMMVDQAKKGRNVFLNNPSERALVGYSVPDWNRNMFSQIATSELNDKAQSQQHRFERAYYNKKRAGHSEEHLAAFRRKHGQFLADFDDAQVDQNWMQKAYYAIRSMAESDEEAGAAFKDFIQHTKDNRQEEAIARTISMPDASAGKQLRAYQKTSQQGY
jgi:hypothetical protein